MEYLVCSLPIELQIALIYAFVKYTTFKNSKFLKNCAFFGNFDLMNHVILNDSRRYKNNDI